MYVSGYESYTVILLHTYGTMIICCLVWFHTAPTNRNARKETCCGVRSAEDILLNHFVYIIHHLFCVSISHGSSLNRLQLQKKKFYLHSKMHSMLSLLTYAVESIQNQIAFSLQSDHPAGGCLDPTS